MREVVRLAVLSEFSEKVKNVKLYVLTSFRRLYIIYSTAPDPNPDPHN